MTKRFDLYGWAVSSIDEAAGRVGPLLGVELHPHESSYRGGGYYLWRGMESEEMILQMNFRDEEGFLVEEDFEKYPILLYASGLSLEDFGRLANLSPLTLLRSEIL